MTAGTPTETFLLDGSSTSCSRVAGRCICSCWT